MKKETLEKDKQKRAIIFNLIGFRLLVMVGVLLMSSLLLTATLSAQRNKASSFKLLNPGSTPGSNNPFLIQNAEDLQSLGEVVTKGRSEIYRTAHYRLVNDIVLSGSNNFIPIGTAEKPFNGVFDGNRHSIIGLAYTGEEFRDVGLFGEVAGAKIHDLTLSEPMIINNYSKERKAQFMSTGALVGTAGEGTQISNVTTAGGAVTGDWYVGGLVGRNSGIITASTATGAVTGWNIVGGLVGGDFVGVITTSTATGTVTGDGGVGGLVGSNYGSVITASIATGAVTGEWAVGGLVGNNDRSKITASTATGAVTGKWTVGGLVGENTAESVIITSYATGTVTGEWNVGGLVGDNFGRDTITSSYWDRETIGENIGEPVGQTPSAGGEGYKTSQLQNPLSYTDIYKGWRIDINNDGVVDDPWSFGSSSEYPVLDSEKVSALSWNDLNRPDISSPQGGKGGNRTSEERGHAAFIGISAIGGALVLGILIWGIREDRQ